MTEELGVYDVVIVGGGVMGSSCAYWLMLDGGVSVAVIERDASYATASSALSASSIRQQFSTPVCISMSRFGMDFLQTVAEHLTVDDVAPEIGLMQRGYLYLADERNASQLNANVAIQCANGASIAALSQDALSTRFPWLNTVDIAAGSLGLRGEGWFDGYALLQAFKSKARDLGARYINDDAVGFVRSGDRIDGVELASGRRIISNTVVNAAGPRAGQVSKWAGLPLPIVPQRRTVFVFSCRDVVHGLPLVIDPTGLYFREEGNFFISGGPAVSRAADPFDLSPDYEQFDEFIWPTLAHRVPAFESIKMLRAWAGHYEMNLFDHNAVLGRIPGVDNLMVVAGFSGHGMQHAAAAGRGISELILHRGFRTLDLSPLSPERLISGTKLTEQNVI